MGAYEGLQDPRDRLSVSHRVLGDALQREEPAEPHVELVAAELVDGACEPLGDLSLAAD